MNDELLKQLDAALSGATGAALAPLITLLVGIMLLLIAEITPALTRSRPAIFIATILATLYSLMSLRNAPPGLVLYDSFKVDQWTVSWGIIFMFSALIAWTFGRRYYKKSSAFIGEHDVLLLCTPLGMLLMAGAQDLLVFFVGLELLSIPLYCLSAFRRTRNDSVEAGLKYFVLGAFAAATFLFGAALLYTATGTISLHTFAEALANQGPIAERLGSSLAIMGIALIAASLFFKVGVFPFHLWVPDVYQGAPSPVTVLMATGTKAAGFAFLLNAAFLLPASSATLLGLLALATMVVGNLGALVQGDLKRMLAYSSVAHAGVMLLLVAASVNGSADTSKMSQELFSTGVMEAAIFYMAAYVFTAGGAFGLICWLEADGDHFTSIESLKGLASRRPGMAAAMALFLLSLGGIPGTGGFLGKYYVFSTAVHSGMITIAVLGALTSVIALGYYLRVVVAMYMEPAPEGIAAPSAKRLGSFVATGACATAVVLLGVLPQQIWDYVL